MNSIPDPNAIFPNEYGTSCFIKNVITVPNISVGDYTCYDDPVDPTGFERNNVLFNYPECGDRLIIGKLCQIASGVKFIMGPADHRLCSVTTYPFSVFGGVWSECIPPHMDQLPRKGDTIADNDVWLRPRERRHAGCEDRRRRDHRRVFRGGDGRAALHALRRQSRALHQKALRR